MSAGRGDQHTLQGPERSGTRGTPRTLWGGMGDLQGCKQQTPRSQYSPQQHTPAPHTGWEAPGTGAHRKEELFRN